MSTVKDNTVTPVIQPAKEEHVPQIKAMVDAAYTKYIERIGKPPAPMNADYMEILKTHDVYVLRDGNDLAGSIVLHEDKSDSDPTLTIIKVNNVVVNPSCQGRGYGRILMEYAELEARKRGMNVIELFTNVKMVENLGLYVKLGYTETGRRNEDGYDRVYFRKELR